MKKARIKIREEILSSLKASGMLCKKIKYIEAHIVTSLYANGEELVDKWEGIITTGCGWKLDSDELQIGWSNKNQHAQRSIRKVGGGNLESLITDHENYVLKIIKDELDRGVIQGISSLPSLIFSRYAKVNNDQKVSGIETHRQLIIGASHLCVGKIFTSIYPSCLSINNSPVIRLEKTEHCSNNNKKINIIDVLGFAGLPIFNKLTLNLISEAYKTNTNSIIWMVPDFRINNIEIDILRKRKRRTSEKYYNNTNVQQDLFIDSQFATIDKSLLNHDNDVFMVTYGQEVIDYIIKRFPTIKLMFWCAYKRFAHSNIESEKVNSLFPEYSKSMTSVYKDLYPQLVYKYSDNIIDIRKKCPSLKEFDREMTFDPGGHPSEKGYQLIKDLIRN